ncbi:sulfate adenylyltransferase [Helicobacter anatolicus]|uniref:sulfate adenylyltransferase n=1 Tax=Helicobacter anatolicus TaxID=2905874 RepID=UPI001E484653|nr:sulfate adenylyltransferase [Helicobacter anatolicus]MCE3038516.1 sulfate adenylyltransferase [Helicobacter anatolicus]
MKSQEKNKQLYIDNEAVSALSFLQEGLLSPVKKLMNKKETEQVVKTGMYQNVSYPCPFLLSPSGRRNEEVLKNVQKNEQIDLVCERKIVGSIQVDEVFPIDIEERLSQIGAILEEKDYIARRIGKYALSGKVEIENQINNLKQLVNDKKEKLKAKRITGVIFNANPIHRVHEKILREEFNDSDMIVIFLLRYHREDFLSFEIRQKSLDLVLNKFLSKERICVVPLDVTYLFAGPNKMILYALIAKNFGCTKILLGQKTRGLSVYYNHRTRHSVFDSLKGIDIEVKILDEYAYCTKCRCLLNAKSCPHGQHHHIIYYAESLLQFFKMGIIPPTILVRKEVSALILKELFPERLEEMKQIYYGALPSDGVFSENVQEDFYTKLIDLYQIRN